jgi:formylglycine-generating enzyme required for sulfatase activity
MMTPKPKNWTREEIAEALSAFFETEEARRFRELFARHGSADDRAAFRRDAERRAASANERAAGWWRSLAGLLDPERLLTLAEPLAQHGLDIEELYEHLPADFEPRALVRAIARATGAEPDELSNADNWTEAQIQARLEEVLPRLDWEGAHASVWAWWTAFADDNRSRPGVVLRIAEQLALRNATLAQFYDASRDAGVESIEATLHYLDYTRGKAAEPAGAAGLTSDDSGWWMKPAPHLTKVRGWRDERIRARLDEVKSKMDWEEAGETVQAWWMDFEERNGHRLALALRLAEELAHRMTTLAGFHSAVKRARAADIRANLHYLDYERLKADEERAAETKRRQEAREAKRLERMTRARAFFREMLPLLASDQPPLEWSAADRNILLSLPREDVPAELRDRFERALGPFDFETVTLDETGTVTGRPSGRARCRVEELIPGVALELVEIPGGAFQMGTSEADTGKEINEVARYNSREAAEQWIAQEMPSREVNVPPFLMGRFAITQEQWAVVASWEPIESELDADPARFKGDDRPIESISWEDAKEFCARLSHKTGREYCLPTEAEWEYACRAGTTTPFAFGETITPEIVNYDGEYPYANAEQGVNRRETVPVGSLGVANAFGIYDMHGNVWEWCEDVWHSNYTGAPTDGSAWLSGGDSTFWVLRGGSWGNRSIVCRSAGRYWFSPVARVVNIGLRVVVRAF